MTVHDRNTLYWAQKGKKLTKTSDLHEQTVHCSFLPLVAHFNTSLLHGWLKQMIAEYFQVHDSLVSLERPYGFSQTFFRFPYPDYILEKPRNKPPDQHIV